MPQRPLLRSDLEEMTTEELQAVYSEVSGVNVRSTKREYLISNIRRVLAAKVLNPQDHKPPVVSIPRGATVYELRQVYRKIVGRPTRSTTPHYLRGKIRQAMRGQIALGPRTWGAGPAPNESVRVALFFDPGVLAFVDAGRRRMRLRSRMVLVRRALHDYLAAVGEAEAAAAIKPWLHDFDVPAPPEERCHDIALPEGRPQPGTGAGYKRVLLRLEPATIDLIDDAQERLELASRMDLIRTALHRFFAVNGETEIADAIEPWLQGTEAERISAQGDEPAVIEHLRALHEEIVGTPTAGISAPQLRARITKALKKGKRKANRPKPGESISYQIPVAPWGPRLLDAGQRRLGLRTRATMIRLALHDYLRTKGLRTAVKALAAWLRPFDVPLPQADRADVEIPAVPQTQPGSPYTAISVLLEPETIDRLDDACWRMRVRTRQELLQAAMHAFFLAHDEPEIAAAWASWEPAPRKRGRGRKRR